MDVTLRVAGRIPQRRTELDYMLKVSAIRPPMTIGGGGSRSTAWLGLCPRRRRRAHRLRKRLMGRSHSCLHLGHSRGRSRATTRHRDAAHPRSPLRRRGRGCAWLHVDFEESLASFYVDACGFRPTPAGLIELWRIDRPTNPEPESEPSRRSGLRSIPVIRPSRTRCPSRSKRTEDSCSRRPSQNPSSCIRCG